MDQEPDKEKPKEKTRLPMPSGGIAGVGLLAAIITPLLFHGCSELEKKQQPTPQAVAQPTPQPVQPRNPDWYGVEQTIIVKDGCSPGVRVTGDRCITTWEEGQSKVVNAVEEIIPKLKGDTWVDLNEHRKSKKKDITLAHWRVCSKDSTKSVVVKYKFLKPGECYEGRGASAPTPQHIVPQGSQSNVESMTVTDVWSKPIMLANDRCHRWWGEDPDAAEFESQLKGSGGDWMPSGEYLKKNPGSHASWIRFRATGNQATVYFTTFALESSRCKPHVTP